jgi:branched-chain amino acid transport system ATP-binding protein
VLSLKNVQVLYDRAIEAVRDVSIEVPRGAIVALLGSNGAGKSTILKAISGVLAQEDGEIVNGSVHLDGAPISGRSPREIVRAGLLQVPEARALFATLTVEKDLLVLRVRGPSVRRPSSESTRYSRASRSGGGKFPAICREASSRW